MEEKILLKTEKAPLARIRNLAITLALIAFCTCFGICLTAELDFITSSWFSLLCSLGLFALIFAIGVILNQSELTITNKRAFGKGVFGKRVDLPLDSITSVGTSKLFNRLSIFSPSGNLTFWCIVNLDDFHSTLSQLLIERQNNPKKSTEIKQEIPQDNADELMKYKGLLDCGAITQEEFDAKKKQLLGL